MKKLFVSGLLGLVFLATGCFGGISETADLTREFFQLVADGESQAAYDSTADGFREVTSYDDFLELVELAELELYVDFQTTGFEVNTDNGVTEQVLLGDFYDSAGYYYPLEVYWLKINDGEWELLGFYFLEE